MKIVLVLIAFLSFAANAQDVYICTDKNGERYYKNTGSTAGCNKVRFPRYVEKPLSLGMSKDQVRSLWGAPADTRTVTNRRAKIETWRFDDGSRLNFVNGSLETIETD